MDVERHICEVLEAAGLATLGVDLFMGIVRDSNHIPADAFFVHRYDGDVTPFMGGRDATDLHEDRVQIRIRDQSREDGNALAHLVWKKLHKQDRPVDGYAGWLAKKPLYMKFDKKGRHHWSINLKATYEE